MKLFFFHYTFTCDHAFCLTDKADERPHEVTAKDGRGGACAWPYRHHGFTFFRVSSFFRGTAVFSLLCRFSVYYGKFPFPRGEDLPSNALSGDELPWYKSR